MAHRPQVVIIQSKRCPRSTRSRLPLPDEPSPLQCAEAAERAQRGQELDEFREWFDENPPKVWENFIE